MRLQPSSIHRHTKRFLSFLVVKCPTSVRFNRGGISCFSSSDYRGTLGMFGLRTAGPTERSFSSCVFMFYWLNNLIMIRIIYGDKAQQIGQRDELSLRQRGSASVVTLRPCTSKWPHKVNSYDRSWVCPPSCFATRFVQIQHNSKSITKITEVANKYVKHQMSWR